MAKASKGLVVKLMRSKRQSVIFPKIKYPQYYDVRTDKYITIKNDDELRQAEIIKKRLEYGGMLIIPKGSEEAKCITKAVNQVWKEYELDKNPRANYPLKDGDVKADELEAQEKNGDYYRGNIYFKFGTTKEFQCFNNTDKSNDKWKPKSDDDISGYFVRIGLYVGYYKKGSNVGVKLFLNAIQFLEKNPDLQFREDFSNEFTFEEPVPNAMELVDNGENETIVNDNDSDDVDGGYPLVDNPQQQPTLTQPNLSPGTPGTNQENPFG